MACISEWHPVLAAHQLRAGKNIVGALVQGKELALWRSLDGRAQAWDNRCPHRGARLSLGRILNGRLSCAYHGWEYAAGSGRCEAIPALPAIPVPGKVCVKTFAVIEAQAMVWVGLDHAAAGDPGSDNAAAATVAPAPADAQPGLAPQSYCRALAVRVTAGQLHHGLSRHGFVGQHHATWHGTLAQLPVIAFTLSAAPELSFVHLWCASRPGPQDMQRLFAAARRLRSDLEAEACAKAGA